MVTASNMMRRLLSAFCILGLVSHTFAIECHTLGSCDTCTGIQGKANECVWCLDKSNAFTASTNDFPPVNAAGQCSTSCPVDTNLADADSATLGVRKSVVTSTKNDKYDINDVTFGGIDVTEVNIVLRRGDTARFNVAVKKGPMKLQLYFLLDLSGSMLPVFDSIKESAGGQLPSIFDNDPFEVKPNPFAYGFGSFVDKAIPPFTFNRFDYSTPTYGFRHAVDFTSEASIFRGAITDVKLSGNSDAPEGGLEALVQVLYCDQWIEWSSVGGDTPSIRLVLMVTDQTSHVAGDGIEAGLVWPAEMKCHNQLFFGSDNKYVSELMNPLETSTSCNGRYCTYHNAIHDYPSVSQIKEALEMRETTVAFVVPSDDENLAPNSPGVRNHYKQIAELLENRGVLTSDPISANPASMDFSSIVRNTYYEVFKQVPVFTSIEEGSDPEFDTYYKIGVSSGNSLETVCSLDPTGIRATITLYDEEEELQLLYNCEFAVIAKAASTSKALKQVQSSGSWGKFIVNVQSSDCNCPSTDFFDGLDNIKCNNNGVLNVDQCGVCQCNPGSEGDHCSCTEEDKWAACPKGSNGLECSGVDYGTCECKRCKCKEGYTGSVCDCGDQCGEPDEAKRCGGVGECICDECQCPQPQYSGKNCECDKNLCLNDVGIECSDNGKCNCNKCECDLPFYGDHCQFCDAELGLSMVPPRYCGDDSLCDVCTFNPATDDKEDPTADTWGCDCCFAVTKTNYSAADSGGSFCQWCSESNQCFSRTTLNRAQRDKTNLCSSGVTTVKIELEEETQLIKEPIYAIYNSSSQCPPPIPYDPFPVIVGTILGLLALLLLALLLWRLLSHLKDKKEWEQYEKDKAKSKWQADNNPIFKSSVAEFENPIFE